MGLSACMIVKNEEHFLPEALTSLQGLADELIIVDTGSTDTTKTIAKTFTPHVYDYPWKDDFSAARNYSLTKATHDWILVLDADKAIAHEDHEAIRALTHHTDFVACSLVQVNYTNDTTLLGYTPIKNRTTYTKNFTGSITCNIIRLFQNHKNIRFAGAVHESVDATATAQGRILKTNIPLHHYQFLKGTTTQKQLKYLEIYERNITTYPNQARAHRDLGILYYNYKHDYPKAATHFEQSLALNPHNIKTYVGLTLCLLKLNRHEQAQHALTQALHRFPQDATLHHLLRQLTHR